MSNWFFYFGILLAISLSAYLTNKAGILNIATEGFFVWSNFLCFFFLYYNFSFFWVCFLSFICIEIFMMLLYFFIFILKINENFVGIFFNIFLTSLIDLINSVFWKKQAIIAFPKVSFSYLYFYREVSALFFFFFWLFITIILFRTSLGLRLRLACVSSLWKQERGYSPYKDQWILLTISSFLIILSSFILVSSLGAYTLNLGAGMGWIGLFALLLGFSSAVGILLASGFLSFVLNLSFSLQESFNVYFSTSLPYFICLLSYLLFSIIKTKKNLNF